MISKPVDMVTAEDLKALVADSVREARRLEYKQTLPGNSDGDKKEFLADVASLANAGGGDIIYGIRDEDGTAAEALGLADFNEDNERLRLENIIRDGAAPRIPGIQLSAIPGFANGPILIIRVPRSWSGPHMVTFKGSSRFFTRSSNGKFQMDITELRNAFEGTAELPERIARWRDERLGRIVANEGPVRLNSGTCLVLHMIPLESFGTEWRLHGTDFSNLQSPFRPIASSGWSHRINIDGFVTFSPDRVNEGTVCSYTQLFRSGRIEAVSTDIANEREGTRWIASQWYEKTILEIMGSFLEGLSSLDIQPPFIFMMSFIGAKGAYMATDPRLGSYGSPIDRDMVQFPEVIIESFDVDLSIILRPVFDAVWNACGFPQSLNYDRDGKWCAK